VLSKPAAIFLFCLAFCGQTFALDVHVFLEKSEVPDFKKVFGKKIASKDASVADLYPEPVYLSADQKEKDRSALDQDEIEEAEKAQKSAIQEKARQAKVLGAAIEAALVLSQKEPRSKPESNGDKGFYWDLPELQSDPYLVTLFVHGDGNPWIIGRKHGTQADFTPYTFALKLAPSLAALKQVFDESKDKKLHVLRIVLFTCNSASPFLLPKAEQETSFAQELSYAMDVLGFTGVKVLGFTGYLQSSNKKLRYDSVDAKLAGGVKAKKTADSMSLSQGVASFMNGAQVKKSLRPKLGEILEITRKQWMPPFEKSKSKFLKKY
jgi:hypothetical protein